MPHPRSVKRWGPTGLLTMVLALTMTLFGAAVMPASAAHPPGRLHAKAKHVKVTAPVRGLTSSGRVVRGAFVPRKLVQSDGKLLARGILKGKIVRPGKDRKFRQRATMVVRSVDGHSAAPPTARAAAFPPTPASGACNVLNLVLAPLDLNILGLQVHLNQVVLNIVAQSGSKQLLGNLLCFVAGLLDGGSPLSTLLTRVQGLLNRLLGALGGLSA